MLENLREQVLEIFIRLQMFRLRYLHDAVDRGAGLGAVNGVKDTPIVAAYAERSDCSLTGGVFYGNAAILRIHFQILLLVHTVSQLLRRTQNGQRPYRRIHKRPGQAPPQAFPHASD